MTCICIHTQLTEHIRSDAGSHKLVTADHYPERGHLFAGA